MMYHNITMDDMKNGDGLRTVLWTSGCSHCCPGCQNSITWDANNGIPFDEWAEAELLDNLSKPWIQGITLSGGDPLYMGNRERIGQLISKIKKLFPDKDIWCYTGWTFEQLQEQKLPFLSDIDILVDGRYIEKQRDTSLYWRGSSNQRVIDVKKSLATGRIVLHCD